MDNNSGDISRGTLQISFDIPELPQSTTHHPSCTALSSSNLFSGFGTLSLFIHVSQHSNTDKISQNAKTFSLPYWTLREWWASCCSTQQILASADYEIGRENRALICSRPLFLKAAALWPPTCPGWASLVPSIYSKYTSPPFEAGILTSGRMLLTIWPLLPSRTTSV